MRLPTLSLALLAAATLAGCAAGDARPPTLGLAPDSYRPPVTRSCDNYADQTARNTYENLSDPDDSFSASAFNRQRAEREGRDAYERCRAGRLN